MTGKGGRDRCRLPLQIRHGEEQRPMNTTLADHASVDILIES